MARHARSEERSDRRRRDSGIEDRRAGRERLRMHELDCRIIRQLELLEMQEAISGWEHDGPSPHEPKVSSVFSVTGSDRRARRFVCTYDQRVARSVNEARGRGLAVTAILVTHEMRPEKLRQRIVGLTKN